MSPRSPILPVSSLPVVQESSKGDYQNICCMARSVLESVSGYYGSPIMFHI